MKTDFCVFHFFIIRIIFQISLSYLYHISSNISFFVSFLSLSPISLVSFILVMFTLLLHFALCLHCFFFFSYYLLLSIFFLVISFYLLSYFFTTWLNCLFFLSSKLESENGIFLQKYYKYILFLYLHFVMSVKESFHLYCTKVRILVHSASK